MGSCRVASSWAGSPSPERLPSRAVDLGGWWLIAPSDDEVRRAFSATDFDDADWTSSSVPGHWQTTPGFAEVDGPVLHRRRFDAAVPADANRRSWLVFDGLCAQADVWLDGAYLGDAEGYAAQHRFDVTDALGVRSEHVLAVELACSPQSGQRKRRNGTGALQDGQHLDPSWNPGGIWQPVRLVESGPVAIVALRVRCIEATEERAQLEITATLDALVTGSVHLRTLVDPGMASTEHDFERRLGAGLNDVTWRVKVEQPRLWWPWALLPGSAPAPTMIDVIVEVTPLDGALSDRTIRRTGLRHVTERGMRFSINGEPMFLKGACLGPAAADLAGVSPSLIEGDVHLAREAGLDLVRVRAHVSRPELYATADRLGMLIWQDLPVRWNQARGTRRQSVAHAKAIVDRLCHHPSIALWCAHDEPVVPRPLGDLVALGTATAKPWHGAFRAVVRSAAPTWNRTVLDTALSRALDKADGSRPVLAHSGVLPHPAWGTDTHLGLGWRRGSADDLAALVRQLPVIGRFMGDLGSPAPALDDPALGPGDDWSKVDWDALGRRGIPRSALEVRVPTDRHATPRSWAEALQEAQVDGLDRQIRHLRRLKYRPTGGFTIALLADAEPGIGFGVLDHHRDPKPAWAAIIAACAPLIVAIDDLPPAVRPGHAMAIDVHVVNDERAPVERLRVDASLASPDGWRSWAYCGDVGADGVARVATISIVAPASPGDLELVVTLSTNDGMRVSEATTRARITD